MKGVRFLDAYQRAVLSDRFLETLLGDARFLGMRLVHVGLVLGVLAMVKLGWFGEGEVLSVMAGGALWLGYASACGVLVGERVMFERERAVAGLDVAAYLYSRARGLSVLGTVLVLLMVLISGGLPDVAVGWLLIALLGTMACGVCMGLMMSAGVKTKMQALWVGIGLWGVFFVAKLLLKVQEGSVVLWILPMIRWTVWSLEEFGQEASDLLLACGYLLPLGGFSVLFWVVGYGYLKRLA